MSIKISFSQFQKILFESISYPTESDLRKKELEFHIGDKVQVVKDIRCRQTGKTGTIIETPKGMDDKTKYGWKLFYVKFDDPQYGIVGFQSGSINKV